MSLGRQGRQRGELNARLFFADQAVKIKQRLTTRIKNTHIYTHKNSHAQKSPLLFSVIHGAFIKLIKN